MNPYKVTFHTYNKIAQSYQDKFMDLDLYNDTYDLFCNLIIKPGSEIFEIGCGPGNITKYLLQKRPDFILTAIDISPNMIELAKQNNPEASFKVMDCRNIDIVTGRYDGIICGFCLPYLSKEDCAKLVKDTSAIISKAGLLYLSAIEGEYENSGYETGSTGDKVYVYYHQEDYLSAQLKAYNFEVIEIIRKSYQKSDSSFSTHLILLARKM